MLKKAITFSFDDGIQQDLRLIEIFNKYNLKATFHLNSELLGVGAKFPAQDIKYIYEGHEVSGHTLSHLRLTDLNNDEEIIRQVEQDRLNLSEIVGYEVCGMAYPGGGINGDTRVANILRDNTKIKYARVGATNNRFDPQDDLLLFHASVDVYNEEDKLFQLAENFLNSKTEKPIIFSLRGHAYEFDYDPSSWDRFTELCSFISGKQDVFYGTLKDVLLNYNWR